MLKNLVKRRIITSTLALIIVGLLCFFPTKLNKETKITQDIKYLETTDIPIYLLNKDEYVVRTIRKTTKNEPLAQAKELIETLIIDNLNNEYISPNLKPLIPKNTKILDISLDKGLLKVNFSQEFLNTKEDMEVKIIEALIYSLTEIDEINELMIFINGEKLTFLPQANLILPNTLTRDFGINKIYDIANIKDLTKTTIYYLAKEDDLTYYVPITKLDNNQNNKIEIIIKELKSSPIYETNLISYLASSVELLNYETLEDQVTLSFNNKILANLDEKDILEEVKYSISLSLKDTLNIKEVIFKVNDEIITKV